MSQSLDPKRDSPVHQRLGSLGKKKKRAEMGESGSGLAVSLTKVTSLMPEVWGISTPVGFTRHSEGSVHMKLTLKNFIFPT